MDQKTRKWSNQVAVFLAAVTVAVCLELTALYVDWGAKLRLAIR